MQLTNVFLKPVVGGTTGYFMIAVAATTAQG